MFAFLITMYVFCRINSQMVNLKLPVKWREQYVQYYQDYVTVVGSVNALGRTLDLMADEKRAITDEW